MLSFKNNLHFDKAVELSVECQSTTASLFRALFFSNHLNVSSSVLPVLNDNFCWFAILKDYIKFSIDDIRIYR